jgi:hypothetical protein
VAQGDTLNIKKIEHGIYSFINISFSFELYAKPCRNIYGMRQKHLFFKYNNILMQSGKIY